MTALARAGWVLGALFFATIAVVASCTSTTSAWSRSCCSCSFGLLARRPARDRAAGRSPRRSRSPGSSSRNDGIPPSPWAEAVVCAALAGLSRRMRRVAAGAAALPASQSRAPALLFGASWWPSSSPALGVPALRLGPGVPRRARRRRSSREYFIDSRGFPALHAGMLLLEGVLLAGPLGPCSPRRRASAYAASRRDDVSAGATLAAVLNLEHLLQRGMARRRSSGAPSRDCRARCAGTSTTPTSTPRDRTSRWPRSPAPGWRLGDARRGAVRWLGACALDDGGRALAHREPRRLPGD